MSRKNTRTEKKIRSLRRALRKDRLPKYLDLIEWLKVHAYANTSGAARKLIMEERVRSDSHALGISVAEINGRMTNVVERYVPASLRMSIHVVDSTD